MARPHKQTVDYFPHVTSHGKTMYIIENKFGNDGYAFWFKLLEVLGNTDGHVYEYKNPADKEFLLAKTNFTEDNANDLLNLLADLDAIDKGLWEEGYIWSDNFVDNIKDAYKRRKVNVPQKPSLNKVNDNINSQDSEQKLDSEQDNDNKKAQSKVKKSKEDKSKEEKPSDKSDSQSGDEFSITKLDNGRYDYPDEYEEIYEVYPDNNGTKKAGWRKWAARRREKISNDKLLLAAKNYQKKIENENTDKKYVKHIATFYGPDEHWRKYLETKEKNQTEKDKIMDLMGMK